MKRVSVAGPARGRKTLRHLIVDPGPVDLIGQSDQLVLHIDDLIEPGPKKIARALLVALLWSHPMPLLQMDSENHGATKKGIKIARNRSSKPQFLAITITSTGGRTYQIQCV